MKVLITGAAGFIGSRIAEVLADSGVEVLGVDNLNDYYDPVLKVARLHRGGFSFDRTIGLTSGKSCVMSMTYAFPEIGEIYISKSIPTLSFVRMDVRDEEFAGIARDFEPDVVVHLAAQPGVRYSITHPEECLEANILSFMRVMDVCRELRVHRMLYASSSSVYGNHKPHAFRESDDVDSPKSVYAASKRTNELLAGVYSEMYGIKMIGLRFFSVYGEWGRPDMAPYLFADSIMNGKTIRLFNGGQLSRDFTYIEDVAECVRRIVLRGGGVASIGESHELLNIGHGVPTLISDFVDKLEKIIGKKANVTLLPMQPGEVKATLADTSKLTMQYGYFPSTPLEEGLSRFVKWMQTYLQENKQIPLAKKSEEVITPIAIAR